MRSSLCVVAFSDGKRLPPRIKSGAGFFLKMLYRVCADASVTTLRAAASAGFDFERSAPTLASVFIIAACSSGGRLMSSPPRSTQTLRILQLNSTAHGLIDAD